MSNRERSRHRIPTIYTNHEVVAVGGLMSYASPMAEDIRLPGNYSGRILKPADLSVQAKIELIINMKTAKVLGLDVPATVLVRADAVIE
jgi:putative tryptophan/tyrosine transport system substrate-binding protein